MPVSLVESYRDRFLHYKSCRTYSHRKEQFIKLAGCSYLLSQSEFPASFPSFLLLCICPLTFLFDSFPTIPEHSCKVEKYPSNSSQSFSAYQVLNLHIYFPEVIPCGSDGKASACQFRRPRFNPWVGKIPGEGNGNPLHYSCLENPMDWGAWWAIVHGVARVRHDWPAFTFSAVCK